MLGLNQLWDESPKVQHERARARIEGRAEGLTEGLEISVETAVNVRFPALTSDMDF
jgi:hypothetical protein